MNEAPPMVEPPPPTTVSGSWWSRMFNVIAEPGEVFASLKDAPVCHANWIGPAIISVIISWIGVTLIFAQPSIQQQIREMTDKAIQTQIEKGKMSKEQAEQARAVADKFAGIGQKVSGYAGPPFTAFASPLLWGLFLWLGGKVLKGGFSYFKAVEVVGLGNVVMILDGVLRTLLILVTGNLFAAVSPALLISEFDAQNPVHTLLSNLDLIVFWGLAVRGIGLSKLSASSIGTAKGLAWVFGVWVAYTGFFAGIGFAVRAIFKT